ncbi:hypothetical protein Csa_012939 [Cucumis sativus]|uniref:Uncharacterized protein n=1 Tax=Cucumis sativus TaxID=3659 RepID=A0A0A0KY27_CUCSA|nr:hypothetical protein Csa_012939 [Cucumis sativus]
MIISLSATSCRRRRRKVIIPHYGLMYRDVEVTCFAKNLDQNESFGFPRHVRDRCRGKAKQYINEYIFRDVRFPDVTKSCIGNILTQTSRKVQQRRHFFQ